MDVSIIFVNYKTKDLTINAINSVIEKTEDLNYEIFVVDNASNDGSIEAIEQKFPDINIIKNPINAGFGAANNLAIKQANGKYILCLNTDILLVNNAIKIMFDYMEKDENKNVVVCGGYLVDKDGKPVYSGGNFPSVTNIIWKFGLRNIFKKEYAKYCTALYANEISTEEIDQILGADLFLRKSVINEIGSFDEDYFMYSEETDLCKRIKKNGFHIRFVSNAKMIHLEGQSTPNNLNKILTFKKSEMLYLKKHHPYKIHIIKMLYSILYLSNWLIMKNSNSKEILKVIWEDK